MDVSIYHTALLALSLPLPMYSLCFTILTLQIQAQTTPPYIYVLTIFIALSQMPYRHPHLCPLSPIHIQRSMNYKDTCTLPTIIMKMPLNGHLLGSLKSINTTQRVSFRCKNMYGQPHIVSNPLMWWTIQI